MPFHPAPEPYVQHPEEKAPEKKPCAVVAAIIELGGMILCVQRGASQYPYIHGKWEFPGGKIEPGESPEAALTREIQEELHLSIAVDRHLITVAHDYPDFHISLAAYRCTTAAGNPILTEHVAHRWLSAADPEFLALDWAAADIPILQALTGS